MKKQINKFLNFFESLTQAFPVYHNEEPPKTLWAFCRYYSRGFGLPLLLLAIFSLFRSVLEVSIFGFLNEIVTMLSSAHRESFFADNKWRLLLMTAVLLIFLPLANAGSSLLRNQCLMGNFPMSIRWRAHSHLLTQSLAFYQDEFAGRIAAKVMQTALAIRELITKSVDLFVYIAVYLVSMFVLIGSVSAVLLIPVIIWFLLYCYLQIYFVPKLKKVSQEQANARSTMTGRITDAYTNISTVKLFAHTKRESDYARDSMNDFMDTVYRQFRLVTGLNVCMQSLNFFLLFTLTATAVVLWSRDMAEVGVVAMSVALAMRLNGMSQWILWEVSSMFEQIGTTIDGMNTLSLPKTVQDKADARDLVLKDGEIKFENVCFAYKRNSRSKTPEAEKAIKRLAVINNLNLTIKPGEKIGLVGRSGAGKSTLVNVLLRFYDLESGKITIDGQNIAELKQDSLRRHIAMVTQDTSLLHRSVRDNILYGKPDATEEELRRAIEQSEAAEFIEHLSDPQGNVGLDAQVGERGVKLSGGQRQRIAIARVLLKDAPILILDEATSALDSEVEAAIQESLNRLMDGKTVIAIAHRLSTIAAMDRLIVLDGGQIAEEGTHAELLAKNGIYAKLWSRQTGGYLGDLD
ncbi:MAG: ABC transporter ATP-binding protein [Cardiobacteriaceae bacterium]|nr:ABC transporter ATP-binding protein [Cardiobacteriaceae bacterium]